MRASRTVLALTLAAASTAGVVAGTSATAAVPSRATVPVGGPLVRLSQNVLPLAGLTGVAAPADQVLSLGVALRRPDVAGEDALYKAMYDPKSAQYQHFLTLAEFTARFGVQSERVADVRSMLERSGVVVDAVSADGSYVTAHGTVAAVESAFGVTEQSFSVAGVDFVANTAGPVVPSLDGITTVVGLNTLQKFSSMTAPAQDTCVAGECTGYTSPQDLWSVYNQPDEYTGKGASIAIIGEGTEKQTILNLRAAEKHYGLPEVPLTVNCVQGTVADGSCGGDDGGTGEWQIDTQASTGMAPGLDGETLYFAHDIYDPDLNNSFIQWAMDENGPKIASASLGECEGGPLNSELTSGPLAGTNGNLGPGIGGTGVSQALGNGEQDAVDPVLKAAAMMGKALFASTGDTGSSCPVLILPAVGAGNGVANQGVPEQNYPGVSIYTVASGGTVLYTDDNDSGAGDSYVPAGADTPTTRFEEYAWTFGGGGSSLYTPEPDFQVNTLTVTLPCVTDPTSTCRGVPDVAAQSGDVATNGFSIVTDDGGGEVGYTGGGGTSLSAPLLAGMWARVLGASATNLGQPDPYLYLKGEDAEASARDFTDVIVGANGLYAATPGWDYTTGYGTLNVDGLICDIDGLPSGRYADAGVDGVCPLTAAAGPGAPVVVPPVTAPVEPPTAPTAPGAPPVAAPVLAHTGLQAGVPVLAVVALLGGVALVRRRRT